MIVHLLCLSEGKSDYSKCTDGPARKEIRVTPTEEDRSAGNFPEGKFCHNMAPRSLQMLKESPTFTHLFVKFTIRAVFNLLQGQWSRPLQDPYEHLVHILMHFYCSLTLVPSSQQSAVHQVTPSPLNATHSHKNYVFFFQLCFQMLYSISQMYSIGESKYTSAFCCLVTF